MDFDTQAKLLEQQKLRYAQMRNQQAPQGKMVGRHFVAPNPLEYLAAGLREFGGMRGEEYATKELGDLQKQKQEAMQGVTSAMLEALRDEPAKTVQPLTPNDDEGNVNPPIQMPARVGSINRAYEIAAKSQFPQFQQMGMQGAIAAAQEQAKAMQPKPVKWEKVELPTQDGGRRVGFVNMNADDPISTFKEGGTENAAMSVGPAGQAYNPRTLQQGQVLADPNKPFTIGAGGAIVPNTDYQTYETNKAKASAPKTSVNVENKNYTTQESEQSKAYGKTLGEMRGVITQSGFDAPKKIAQLDRMEQLIGGLDAGGKGAPLAADIASYAQSMGIKIDPKLGAKEAAQALAIEMASNMRTPGTGPMTDKDFDNFLRRVPDLSKTPEGRKQITGTMRAALQRDLEASKFARDYAKANGGVIDDNFYDAMADFYAKNPVVTPELPKTNARGQSLPKYEGDKEARYQEWKRKQGMQ